MNQTATFSVLLVDPGIQLKTQDNVKYVNRGLLSIASFLKINGTNVTHFPFDYYVNKGRSEQQILVELGDVVREKEIKLVAISNLFIAETENSLKIAEFIKEQFPNVITVIGGMNPTIINKGMIERDEIDFIIRGEGEWALQNLVEALRDGKSFDRVSGLVSKDNKAGNERLHGDLDELPPLDYSILPSEYLLGTNPPRINIELSRGCKHGCSFCSVREFWQHKVRAHNPEKVIREMEQLRDLGYKGEFTMEESTIYFKTARVKNFLRKLIAFRDDFGFDYTASRYDAIDEESLALLDEVGFKTIIFGLESASQKIQEKIGKGIDMKKFVEACKMVKKFKINLSFFMIVGLPGETEETAEETLKFLADLMDQGLLQSVFPCNYAPYRGTKASEDLALAGGRRLAEEKDYFQWLMRSEPLVEYPHLKKDQLKDIMSQMLSLNKGVGNAPVDKIK